MQRETYCVIHGSYRNECVSHWWKYSVRPMLGNNFLICKEVLHNYFVPILKQAHTRVSGREPEINRDIYTTGRIKAIQKKPVEVSSVLTDDRGQYLVAHCETQ